LLHPHGSGSQAGSQTELAHKQELVRMLVASMRVHAAAASVVQASEQAWATATSCSATATSPTSFYLAAVHRQTSKQHCGDDRHTTQKVRFI
jgi:hypothetical protein